MDAVTKSLIKEFVDTQGITATDDSEQFEHFVDYLIAFDQVAGDFEIELLSSGEGKLGVDGLAIVVNDSIIEDEEQLTDIIENSRSLDVTFVFIQSKTASKFSLGEILKLLAASKDFFRNAGSLNTKNKKISSALVMKNIIYENAGKFTRGLPRLHMYYATTGTWKNPEDINAAVDAERQEIEGLHLFSDIRFIPIDAGRLQSLYFRTKNAVKAEVEFPNNVSLPAIGGVREAFIGVIKLSEYKKIVLYEKGDVNKKIFFDNVRDFQGDTEVNKSIGETLSSAGAVQFPLRNNGVTVVARSLNRVGNKFVIEDYQIVNGCQTSHMIAGMPERQDEASIYCPIKIVNTEDEDAIKSIIIASNSQNGVDPESFWSLDDIHKKIEIFFQSKPDERKLLHMRGGRGNTTSLLT